MNKVLKKDLSNRELEVLEAVSCGMDVSEIAKKFHEIP